MLTLALLTISHAALAMDAAVAVACPEWKVTSILSELAPTTSSDRYQLAHNLPPGEFLRGQAYKVGGLFVSADIWPKGSFVTSVMLYIVDPADNDGSRQTKGERDRLWREAGERSDQIVTQLSSRCSAFGYREKAMALAEQPEMALAEVCRQLGDSVGQPQTFGGTMTSPRDKVTGCAMMPPTRSTVTASYGRELPGTAAERAPYASAYGPFERDALAEPSRGNTRTFLIDGKLQGRSLTLSQEGAVISDSHWIGGVADGENYQYDPVSGLPLRLLVYTNGTPTACAGACAEFPNTPKLSPSSFSQVKNQTFMAGVGAAGQTEQDRIASDEAARASAVAQRDAEAATALAAQIARSRKAGPEAAVAQGFGAVSSECSNVQLYSNGLSANGSFDVRGEGDCVEYSQALRKNLVVRKKIQMQIFPKADGQWYLDGSVSYYD